LTAKSTVLHCDKSFHICFIDDASFRKLLPEWRVDMTRISDPIKRYHRDLAMTQILYRYGGMRIPVSFVSLRDLIQVYEQGTRNHRIFVGEMVDRKASSVHHDFSPCMDFMGAPKNHPLLLEWIEYMENKIKRDYTSQSACLGSFDDWAKARVESQQIHLIDGKIIGTKTKLNEQVLLDNLLSKDVILFDENVAGIYIPADEVLQRVNYEWFARMSEKQVLESKMVVSKYLLMATTHGNHRLHLLESMKPKNDWISFWKVPSDAPVWGLKPNYLGDYVEKQSF
jgi:hypothetical protein